MSPLSFLSMPIYEFFSFSKASKCIRRIWGGFSIRISILEFIPSASSGGWTHQLQFMRLCLYFGSSWYGCTATTENKKQPDFLWDDVRGLIIFIFSPSSSWRPECFKARMAWSDTPMVSPQKLKRLILPFPTWVFTWAPMSKNQEHRAPTFVSQSPTTIEMECTVEL